MPDYDIMIMMYDNVLLVFEMASYVINFRCKRAVNTDDAQTKLTHLRHPR